MNRAKADDDESSPAAGIALVCPNNFGTADSIPLAVKFIQTLTNNGAPAQLDFVLDLAKMAVTASGLEFEPSPRATEDLLQSSDVEDVAVFRFAGDDLDSSVELFTAIGRDRLSREVELEGQHLSPCYIKISAKDFAERVPPEAAQMLGRDLRDSQDAWILGDEGVLDALVGELAAWLRADESSNRRKPLLGGAPVEVVVD